MCSAQILEGELIQILYYLRIAEGELKTESDHNWAYTQMERLKPSELLEQIRKKGVNRQTVFEKTLERAFRTRNFLAHRFFHRYNPIMTASECQEVESKLREMAQELDTAYNRLQPLRLALEKKLDFSKHRAEQAEPIIKKFTTVIDSFADK
jgi:hypothetical protein